MNKKIITLPIAVLSLGAIVGCNSANTSTDIETKVKSSEYFHDFKNEDYEKYFEIPTNLNKLDTSVALYALQNARSNIYNANKATINSLTGYTVDSSIDSLAYSDLEEEIKGEGNDRRQYIIDHLRKAEGEQIEAAGVMEMIDASEIDAGFSKKEELRTETKVASGIKTTTINDERTSISLSSDSIIDSHKEYKNATTLNDKYTTYDVDETYDITVFAQENARETGKTGVYTKSKADYYGVPAEYFAVYDENETTEEYNLETLKKSLNNNFTSYVVGNINSLFQRYGLTDSQKEPFSGKTFYDLLDEDTTVITKDPIAEWKAKEELVIDSWKAFNTLQQMTHIYSVYDKDNIYIYQYSPNMRRSSTANKGATIYYNDPKQQIGLVSESYYVYDFELYYELYDEYMESPLSFISDTDDALHLANSSRGILNGYLRDSLGDYNSQLFSRYIDSLVDNFGGKTKADRLQSIDAIFNLMGYLLTSTQSYGLSFITNPKDPVTLKEAIECGYDVDKLLNKFLPIYYGTEMVAKLTKINDEWCISSVALKNASYLLRNENGFILDNPITYSASYSTFALDYAEKTAHEVISYNKDMQIAEPVSVGIIGYNSLTQTNEPSEIYVNNSELDYRPTATGLYDTSIFDWSVLPELKTAGKDGGEVRVFRGYINNGNASLEKLKDPLTEKEALAKVKSSINYFGLSIRDNSETDPKETKYFGYDEKVNAGNNTVYKVTESKIEGSKYPWSEECPRFGMNSSKIYVIAYVDVNAQDIYQDEKGNFGIQFSNASRSKY